MYKIEILEKIERVKNLMQELEFKTLFYNQPLNEESQKNYAKYQRMLTELNTELKIMNKA